MNVIDVPTKPRNFAADEVILKLFYVTKKCLLLIHIVSLLTRSCVFPRRYFKNCIFLNLPPLQVRSDYCKLSWDAPEDDGGTAITQYTVAMMDLSVNQWVTAAETKDRSAGIQGLKPGHLYRYTVLQLDSKIPIISSAGSRCSPSTRRASPPPPS